MLLKEEKWPFESLSFTSGKPDDKVWRNVGPKVIKKKKKIKYVTCEIKQIRHMLFYILNTE